MSRGVYVPSNAMGVVFIEDPVYRNMHEDNSDWLWYDLIEDIRATAKLKYPSLQDINNAWDGEGKVILSNDHCNIVLAEYMGVVSLSLVPVWEDEYRPDLTALHVAWCQQIMDGFMETMHSAFQDTALIKMGTMSNGETVYVRKEHTDHYD